MPLSDPLAVVEDVRRACREVDGQDPVDEAVRLRLKHRGLTGTSAWVEDGGFALRHGTTLDLAVAPDARARGIGGRLAELASTEPGELTAWSHGDHPAARELAVRHGFERARELWVMRRRADVPLPEPAIPAGVTIRPFGEAGDADAVLAVNAAAFAAHPEQGAMSAEDLAQRRAEPWFDPAGLLLAVDAHGSLLGFHWTKEHSDDDGPRHGEVYVLAVAPTSHGRGIGRVLTVAGLRHLADRGLAEVILYVESDNAPALRLYAGLGFSHDAADTHVQYQRRSHGSQPPHRTPPPG